MPNYLAKFFLDEEKPYPERLFSPLSTFYSLSDFFPHGIFI